MVNGKIILGTLSILAAFAAFFELFGNMRSGNSDSLPIVPILGVVSLALWGITAVRSGIGKKGRA